MPHSAPTHWKSLTFHGHANTSTKENSARRVVRIASAPSRRPGVGTHACMASEGQHTAKMTSVPAGVVDHVMDAVAGSFPIILRSRALEETCTSSYMCKANALLLKSLGLPAAFGKFWIQRH